MRQAFLIMTSLALTSSAARAVHAGAPPLQGEAAEHVNEAGSALTTKECIADNDWAGTNPCVVGSRFDPRDKWERRPTGWYGDMRYTTLASGATASWAWNKPANNSTVSVYVFIPSPNAEAYVEYVFGCSNESETTELFSMKIDQSKHFNKWVHIGTTDLAYADRCDLYMNRVDGKTNKMAMDAAKLVTTQ